MPFSDFYHIPVVMHFASAARPQSVLDVGIGMGAYGLLLRQHLDISHQRVEKSAWQMRIDGVELFEGYRNPVWDYAYSRIIMDDARKVLASCDRYDLIMMGDILEHFDRAEARKLIAQAVDRSRILIATTPHYHIEQGAWGGNEAETHRCVLDESDFAELVASQRVSATTCYVCSRDAEMIRRIKDASGNCPAYRINSLPYWKRRVERKLERVLGVSL